MSLREVEARTGLLVKFARCFDDYRDEELIEHSVVDLIKQRVFGLALGRGAARSAQALGWQEHAHINRLELTPARATNRPLLAGGFYRAKLLASMEESKDAW